MTNHFFLAPNARWQGRDATGQPIINGKLYTYINDTTTPKATYQDFEGENPNTNPVRLDGKGEANIYWEDDEYYRIDLYTEDDQLVYSQSNYPYVMNNNASPTVDVDNVRNVVRNQQFSYWSNGTSFTNFSSSQNTYDYVADDWLFGKTQANSIINFTRVPFTPGDANAISFAPYYIEYECTNIGSGGETNANLYQRYESANTFSSSVVSITFTARIAQGFSVGTLTPIIWQNFGTGGTPSDPVTNTLEAVQLTDAWQTFTQLITIAPVNGKTFGTDGNDSVQLSFQFPSNVMTKIDIQSVQLTPTETVQPYQFESQNDQALRLSRNQTTWFNTSDYKHTVSTTNDPGWVLCNNQTIGNTASNSVVAGNFTKALFKKLWSSVVNTWCPILNSDGTLGTRTTAEEDFNLNKRMSLTLTLGRVLAGANPAAAPSFTRQVNCATDFNIGGNYLQTTDNSSFYNGTLIQFSSSGTLPTSTPQIVANTVYYVLQGASNRIQLATTLAQAITGAPDITFTVVGTGITTLSVDATTLIPGSYLGEEYVALTLPQIPGHIHDSGSLSGTVQTTDIGAGDAPAHVSAILYAPNSTQPVTITGSTGSTGGSSLHNNIPPTLYTNIMIKL